MYHAVCDMSGNVGISHHITDEIKCDHLSNVVAARSSLKGLVCCGYVILVESLHYFQVFIDICIFVV